MNYKKLEIGNFIPQFHLKGTDLKYYNLNSFSDKKYLLVIFSCNHCPYVQAYERRIIEIQKNFEKKGLQVICINSNDDKNYPEDSFENMINRARENKFNFFYLRDESQETAKAFGAAFTPELFLFDEEKKLVYTGKIDDNWQDESKVQNKYLRNALDELIVGKQISVPETFAIGCTIKWKNN